MNPLKLTQTGVNLKVAEVWAQDAIGNVDTAQKQKWNQ